MSLQSGLQKRRRKFLDTMGNYCVCLKKKPLCSFAELEGHFCSIISDKKCSQTIKKLKVELDSCKV